jgi:hypothetical protein
LGSTACRGGRQQRLANRSVSRIDVLDGKCLGVDACERAQSEPDSKADVSRDDWGTYELGTNRIAPFSLQICYSTETSPTTGPFKYQPNHPMTPGSLRSTVQGTILNRTYTPTRMDLTLTIAPDPRPKCTARYRSIESTHAHRDRSNARTIDRSIIRSLKLTPLYGSTVLVLRVLQVLRSRSHAGHGGCPTGCVLHQRRWTGPDRTRRTNERSASSQLLSGRPSFVTPRNTHPASGIRPRRTRRAAAALSSAGRYFLPRLALVLCTRLPGWRRMTTSTTTDRPLFHSSLSRENEPPSRSPRCCPLASWREDGPRGRRRCCQAAAPCACTGRGSEQ